MDDSAIENGISLKWLVFRVARAWKSIVVFAVAVAFLLGMGSVLLKIRVLPNEEVMADARLDFERELAAYVATEENLLFSLDNLEKAQKRQLEYNQKSILMQIDPLRKNVASFQLHVKYEPRILNDFQIRDLSDTILSSYVTYMTSGEMYNYIIENLSYEIESRYLGEILSVSVDYDSDMISASVVHTDLEKCKEILDLAQNGILSRYGSVCANIDAHEILSNNGTAYETIDLSLQDTQESNIQYIADIDIEIQNVNEQLREWEKEPEPKFAYDALEIAKGGIKWTFIGGVVGFFIAAAIFVLLNIMSNKLKNPEDMTNSFGLPIIGLLPAKQEKRAFDGISVKIYKLCGVKIKSQDFDTLAKTAGIAIRSIIMPRSAAKEKPTVALTGVCRAEEIERAAMAMETDEFVLVCAPDILTNADSVGKVASSDFVVIVEEQEKSSMEDIKKELAAIETWNKPVIGALVLNADAI